MLVLPMTKRVVRMVMKMVGGRSLQLRENLLPFFFFFTLFFILFLIFLYFGPENS